MFKFDNSLVKVVNTYKTNEEVDVLDEKLCFIRGKVAKVEGSAATIVYNQENISYLLSNVFKCGEKLPFTPCDAPTTKPIKIKFVPGGCVEDVKKKNIGEFEWDKGDLAKQHKIFEYGWSKKPIMSQLDDIAGVNDKTKLIQGTAAEMGEGMDWFIKLPNGKYDVKVILKLVDNKANQTKFKKTKVPMNFDINEISIVTEAMGLQDEIIHDKPNINVGTGEIRLKWRKGTVSIVQVTITPQNEPEDPGAVRKEIGKNNFKGGDCMKGNTKNCLFYDSQIAKLKCDGIFVKIDAKAPKDLACM